MRFFLNIDQRGGVTSQYGRGKYVLNIYSKLNTSHVSFVSLTFDYYEMMPTPRLELYPTRHLVLLELLECYKIPYRFINVRLHVPMELFRMRA